jgi:hypothetical protein
MRLFFSAAFAAAVSTAGLHYIATGVVAHLSAATAAQCEAQAWPAHQHEAHVAFCIQEGHSLGTTSRK